MTKKILRKIIKNWVEYQVWDKDVFIITEDIVSVATDDTKGVAPYNTSYGYTNITIDSNAWVRWKEWAIYVFVVDTEMVVNSAHGNVRVRIGTTWDWKPVMSWTNSILSWSSYFIQTQTRLFVYKEVRVETWALHMTNDTTYSVMSVAEWKTGTATSSRIVRADYLKQIIEYHIQQNLPTVWDWTITLEDESGNELWSFWLNDTWDKTIVIPAWWWSWGDLDIDSVNALIDTKIWNYDWLFQLESWLYKILNSIDKNDEVWLEDWENWSAIVLNQSSINKISHSYAVMCCLASSEYAMNEVLWNNLSTKELSECWNSISIISEKDISRELYLNSENWLYWLLKLEVSQDAFFTDENTKEEILWKDLSIYLIVNNNDLLELWNDNSVVATNIANNSSYLLQISSNSTKLWSVIDNSTIINAVALDSSCLTEIAWNSASLLVASNNSTIMNILSTDSTYLNEMSDSDFFLYVLQNSDNLLSCSDSVDWKAKINSYEADDLLNSIYHYTWDLWYNSRTELSQDLDSIVVIATNSNAMKIVVNNEECVSYMPYIWWEFTYTWSDQHATWLIWTYKIECWWAWSWSSAWWYASWIFTFNEMTDISIMVGAVWVKWWNTYWFWWSNGGWNNTAWWWLSWVFIWTWAIWVNDSARALVIWGWAWWNNNWNYWKWGWETWWNWGGNSSPRWWWWTQTWRQSWWRTWSWQFQWWTWEWSYWYGWGWWWGWYWGNWSWWDWSYMESLWWWGWSWYVSESYSMTWKVLTQWWWSPARTSWKVVISLA